jgi:hypothetical protein
VAPQGAGNLTDNRVQVDVDLELGGISTGPLRADILDIIYDGNLGTDFLNRFAVSLDLDAGVFWLDPG